MLTVADAAARAAARAAGELDAMLRAYRASASCHGSVWLSEGGTSVGCRSASWAPRPAARDEFPRPGSSDAPVSVREAGGDALVVDVPGHPNTWILVGPCADDTHDALLLHAAFLRVAVGEHLDAAVEVEHAARELGERYEEINLLYTISEILGRAVTLEETAGIILT